MNFKRRIFKRVLQVNIFLSIDKIWRLHILNYFESRHMHAFDEDLV